MADESATLVSKKCVPCEGGVPACSTDQVRDLLRQVEGWRITDDGKRIHREWKMKSFMKAMDFLNRVAEIAEAEGHHPDLHLVSYRLVMIEIWTHAVGGLTENDFILAAKIDAVDSNP